MTVENMAQSHGFHITRKHREIIERLSSGEDVTVYDIGPSRELSQLTGCGIVTVAGKGVLALAVKG